MKKFSVSNFDRNTSTFALSILQILFLCQPANHIIVSTAGKI